MVERTGQRFGAYTLGPHVADGSMGAIYQALHDQTRERVAIKVLHPHVARDAVAVERFRREYETAKSLRHAHIIEVLDFGETADGAEFMTMEFLEGEELSLLLARKGPFRPARTVRVACQLAIALHHAHADGVIHRDLKPDNIFVCSGSNGEEIRVLDFGSVKLQVEIGPKLTMLGTTLGSPCYMSPEQAMGKHDVDPRTDVFAQAAIMHELATGEVAFAGPVITEILRKIVAEDPPAVSIVNPEYPRAFDEVLRKGLRKDKLERFGSSMELAEAMLAAFGLEADVERWASAPVDEIEKSIGDAPNIPPVPPETPSALGTGVAAELPTRGPRGARLTIGVIVAAALILGGWLLLRV